jgi:hypothetical protein
MGTLPGNTIISMGMDPLCARMNARIRVVQETVVANADGSLANVFVKLQGSFPPTPVPATPVSIDQRGCIFGPRVVGARVGQMLQVRNSDRRSTTSTASSGDNGFNQRTEGRRGSAGSLKDEETMLRPRDAQPWTPIAYVGVVSHPYFAVTHDGGTWRLTTMCPPAPQARCDLGMNRCGPPHADRARQRRRAATMVEFSYTGSEKRRARLQDLVPPRRVERSPNISVARNLHVSTAPSDRRRLSAFGEPRQRSRRT